MLARSTNKIMNAKLLRIQWVDQITSTPKKTSDFYSSLLGFVQEEVEEPNDCVSYSLTNKDGEEVFGVVDEANFEGWAPGWVLYFEVENFEAQCAKIEQLGGKIIQKGEKECLLRDPSGAPIVLSPVVSPGK